MNVSTPVQMSRTQAWYLVTLGHITVKGCRTALFTSSAMVLKSPGIADEMEKLCTIGLALSEIHPRIFP